PAPRPGAPVPCVPGRGFTHTGILNKAAQFMPMLSRLTAAAPVALTVLATHVPPAAAWLAGPPGAEVLAWVCHAAYARFCRGVPTGTGQALRCLAERHRAISTPCG